MSQVYKYSNRCFRESCGNTDDVNLGDPLPNSFIFDRDTQTAELKFNSIIIYENSSDR